MWEGHLVVDVEPHHGAETALPHALLDGFHKVLGFQFLDGHFRIAGDVKRIRLDDLHAGEERGEIGGDHLFDPDERLVARDALA